MAGRLPGEASLGESSGHLATPLHIQRLENALQLDVLLHEVQNVFNTPLSDLDDTTETEAEDQTELDGERKGGKLVNGVFTSQQERHLDKMRLYNFTKVKKSRRWLKNILLSDSSDSDCDDRSPTDAELEDMLKFHKLKRVAQADFLVTPEFRQYQYYSSGLLSNNDKFHEHQKLFFGGKKKSKEKSEKKKVKLKRIKTEKITEEEPAQQEDVAEPSIAIPDGVPNAAPVESPPEPVVPVKQLHSKRKNPSAHEAMMTAKRRRLWIALTKKEVTRAQKQKAAAHKEVLQNAKRLAQACQRECRKTGLLSQKVMKDTYGRARRLTKEMLLYWKRYDKVEKEHRRKAEKEAQEQLRMDIELREAKRQQRKLNFLITQTELYAHFVSRKMSTIDHDTRKLEIISQLDEKKPDLTSSRSLLEVKDDDYNCEEMKAQALRNAEEAYVSHQTRTRAFDQEVEHSLKNRKRQEKLQDDFDSEFRLTNPSVSTEEDLPQPKMFVGKLKSYQVRGMNWLYNLYDKGINGILADEMGLGKTVQTIAFLAALAEVQGIWGPFLIIAPASTLHNWQQEFTKFIPKFKVLPYWGTLNERKILRKFWSQKGMHTENASFHVLITSYQLVVSDVKYFQRIKWQYMVLDEAQAIKSTSSVRWKILLGFNCRNRLLLTGTPIQNSMAELWALLHFIMPTLFDSHEEFNEWFSKNIESHAENKSTIDEKHLSRLHMILKPFMLRRIKKDVENELSDKIEILVYCQLTQRQKLLYQGLKNKISIDDLMQSSSSTSSQAQSATSSLMNLVMQFRKVCNHPDLFDRREVKSPFLMKMNTTQLPRLLYYSVILHLDDYSRQKILQHTLSIFHPEHINHSLFPPNCSGMRRYTDCCFSFSRFIGLSPAEISSIAVSGLLARWLACYLTIKAAYRVYHESTWHYNKENRFLGRHGLLLEPIRPTSVANVEFSSRALKGVIFASHCNFVYTFVDHLLHWMPETSEHREMRLRKARSRVSLAVGTGTTQSQNLVKPMHPVHPDQAKSSMHHPVKEEPDGFLQHIPQQISKLESVPTSLPSFLCSIIPKVIVSRMEVYCNDRSALLWFKKLQLCGCPEAYNLLLHGTTEVVPPPRKKANAQFYPQQQCGLLAIQPSCGWSPVSIPDKETLVTDSGKLQVLDMLLAKLKAEAHRVLIYSQMTRMIDLLEIYMWHRKHTYMRLDGSSKISDRRDMVADFQTRSDIFVFLLSTRAGGLGINLTAADTVIFYDSDWNPTVDQQAMDRAHRLGQTKQVTVYRLICKGTIEERILQRAREKSEIQRVVISGGNFKPDTLKPTEVVSLLLDDDELERKFRQRQEERSMSEDGGKDKDKKRKREKFKNKVKGVPGRKKKIVEAAPKPMPQAPFTPAGLDAESVISLDSVPPSPYSEQSLSSIAVVHDESSSEGPLVVDDGSPSSTPVPFPSATGSAMCVGLGHSTPPSGKSAGKRGSGRSRGRPRGSGRRRGTSCRGATLAAAAAELAAAQAGKSAAYAAYGYALQSHSGSSTANSSTGAVTSPGAKLSRSPSSSIRTASALLHLRGGSSHRGRGLASRSSLCLMQAQATTATQHPAGQIIGSSAAAIAAVTQNAQQTTASPGLGFYVQGSPS